MATANETRPAGSGLDPVMLTGARARIEIEWSDASHATGTIMRLRDGQAAGRVAIEELGETLVVAVLEIEPAYRGYGLGSESARLIRGWAESGPWRRLKAWAPPDLGLAVYFWCRMGLRPLHGPGPDGGIWFERVLR